MEGSGWRRGRGGEGRKHLLEPHVALLRHALRHEREVSRAEVRRCGGGEVG